MPPALPQFQTDSFDNVNPIRGDLSLAISQTHIVPGVLKAGEQVNAGDRVKLDSANTVPGLLVFVAADPDEDAFGVIKRTEKQTAFNGDSEDTNKLEVMFSGGPCVYQCGATTLAPGVTVGLDTNGFLVASDGSHNPMGLLIDPVVISSMGRVILGFVPC